MKYGDAVVLVQKNHSDGSLRRLNAIVLASSLRVPTTADRKAIEGAEKTEHLDIAFPVPTLVPDGGVLKTRDTGEIFRPSYDVGPYVDGAWLGYELPDADNLVKAQGVTIENLEGEIGTLKGQLDEQCQKAGAALAKNSELREGHQIAFDSAIKWREYAASLEKIAHVPHIAADETRTTAPSAADLDAVAAEQAAKEATAGDQLSPENVDKPIETVMGIPDQS